MYTHVPLSDYHITFFKAINQFTLGLQPAKSGKLTVRL